MATNNVDIAGMKELILCECQPVAFTDELTKRAANAYYLYPQVHRANVSVVLDAKRDHEVQWTHKWLFRAFVVKEDAIFGAPRILLRGLPRDNAHDACNNLLGMTAECVSKVGALGPMQARVDEHGRMYESDGMRGV